MRKMRTIFTIVKFILLGCGFTAFLFLAADIDDALDKGLKISPFFHATSSKATLAAAMIFSGLLLAGAYYVVYLWVVDDPVNKDIIKYNEIEKSFREEQELKQISDSQYDPY